MVAAASCVIPLFSLYVYVISGCCELKNINVIFKMILTFLCLLYYHLFIIRSLLGRKVIAESLKNCRERMIIIARKKLLLPNTV